MKYVTELTNQSTKVRQIQESEKDWTLAMVRQAAENIGEGKIRLLLIDRGYLDGLTLWTLTNQTAVCKTFCDSVPSVCNPKV